MDEKQYKVCPKCGSTTFEGWVKMPATFSVSSDNKIEIAMSNPMKAEVVEACKCHNCKACYTLDELTVPSVCKECGKVVSADELNEDGICLVCQAKKNNSDVFNLSQEELIRRLLKAEKDKVMASPSAQKIAEKAEPVQTEEPAHAVEDSEEEEKPKTVKKKTKKQPKEEPQEEQEQAVEEPVAVSEDPMQAAVENLINNNVDNNVDNGQNAPFPQFDDIDSLIGNPAPADANVTADIATFSMFSNDGDRF